jgi:CHRD domain
MRRKVSLLVGLAAAGAVLVGALASFAVAQSGNRFDAARMEATFEVPVVSSDATGSFEARLQGNTVEYTLRYSGLESDVRQAHIHFAQDFASGGISVWLCETATVPHPVAGLQAVTPDCGGPRSAEITDSFDASEVIGPGTQGIAVGEFSALLEAMREGLTYANVHSASIPGGEIRAQLKPIGGGS